MKANFASLIKYTAWSVYSLALISCAALLFIYGSSTIVTTLFAYSFILILLLIIVTGTSGGADKNVLLNRKILIGAVLASLFTGEIALRYLFRMNLTYNELHGAHYISEYKKMEKQNFRLWEIFNHKNSWIKTKAPNSVRTISRDGFTFIHQYNSLGLRDVEPASVISDSAKLILGIGDSFTEGVGAHQDSTWLKFFEREWKAQGYLPPVKTFNAGNAGSDVFFEYQLLLKLLPRMHPDMVILSVNSTDVDDFIIRGGMKRFKADGGVAYNDPPWWESIYAVSFISRAVIHSVSDLDWTLLTRHQKEIKSDEGSDSIKACIRMFSKLSQENHFKLLVVFNPTEKEIRQGKLSLDKLATGLSRDTGICVINLLNEFSNAGLITPSNAGNYYWPSDFHNNSAGYKVWGELVAGYLHKNGILQ